MDKSIGVGLIVGLAIATSLYVHNTDRFNTAQKVILYICVFVPPVQWLLILIFILYDYIVKQTSKESKEKRVIQKQTSDYDSKLEYLKDLKDKGILTEEEYKQKEEKINSEKKDTEIQQTEEYRKLKSLFNDGILTKDEFESKIDKIKHQEAEEEQIIKDKKFTYNNQDYYIKDNLIEGFYLITDSELNYGFADKNKILKIETKYEYADSFSDGLALVRLNRKFGFIDYLGKVVIDLMYDDASSFKNGIADVEVGGLKYTINKNGEKE